MKNFNSQTTIFTAAIVATFLFCTSNSQAQQIGAPSPIVKSKTLEWETERDLIILFDSSTNRAVTARTIISIATDPSNSYTDEQRVDGLKVAGSALFTDGIYQEAMDAYVTAISYNIDTAENADLYAGVGECQLKLNLHEEAFGSYQDCVDSYLLSYSNGRNASSWDLPAIFKMLSLSDSPSRLTIGLNYAIDIATAFELQGDLGENLAHVYQCAAMYADWTDDSDHAVEYYTKLLVNFPDYMNDQPIAGIIPNAKIRLLILEGSSWESPDEDLTRAVFDIYENPAFEMMPIRIHYAEKLASSWQDNGYFALAARLRNEIASNAKQAMDTLGSDAHDQEIGMLFSKYRSLSLWNLGMSHYIHTRNYGKSLLAFEEIVNESTFPIQSEVNRAEEMKIKVQSIQN